MTDAGWTREPDFTEVARKLVLKINEIQPDQWDQYDDKDQARIMAALKATYQQGRVEGLREGGPILAKVCEWCEGGTLEQILEEFYAQLKLAQAAQDEKDGGIDEASSDERNPRGR